MEEMGRELYEIPLILNGIYVQLREVDLFNGRAQHPALIILYRNHPAQIAIQNSRSIPKSLKPIPQTPLCIQTKYQNLALALLQHKNNQ